jgi:SAM-dependent methyltransferase
VERSWFHAHLACPDCGRDLDWQEGATACACGFVVDPRHPRDLRPQRPAVREMRFVLGSDALADLDGVTLERPLLTYRGPRALRDSGELLSAADPWFRPGGRLLDLGCGPRDQAEPVAACGLEYVGVDYASPTADLLCDAHAIPFREGTFDVVFAYAVLEHLYNPFLAAAEVTRVLRPGGIFVGTVSQGEPFHDSFFHHTLYGLLCAFRNARLRPLRLWPSYDTLHALSVMGRYPRVQRLMIEAVYRIGRAMPFLAPRKLFTWSEHDKKLDELHRSAAICFVAEKASSPVGEL